MVADVAHEPKFALPLFTTRVKDQRDHGVSVHMIGIPCHLQANSLRLFTMTDEHATGANHIIESIQRLLNECADAGPISGILYLQLDSYWRENKNRY